MNRNEALEELGKMAAPYGCDGDPDSLRERIIEIHKALTDQIVIAGRIARRVVGGPVSATPLIIINEDGEITTLDHLLGLYEGMDVEISLTIVERPEDAENPRGHESEQHPFVSNRWRRRY